MRTKKETTKGVGRRKITDGTKKVQFSFYISDNVLEAIGKDACRVFCIDMLENKYRLLSNQKK